MKNELIKKTKENYFETVNELIRPNINLTRTLPKPTAYSLALDNEYKDVAFNEERAPENRGQWLQKVFKSPVGTPIDLEIGTGTGLHFAFQAEKNPDRCIIGMELKYKPLIQSIRRAYAKDNNRNKIKAAICRYHAFNLDLLFEANEINNVYIHFPDPWTSPHKPKNRVVNRILLRSIYQMQKPNSFLEFKTDSREYFLWALNEIKNTPYKIEFQTLNLYSENGIYKDQNFQTTFEKIFIKQGIEINYIKLIKSE